MVITLILAKRLVNKFHRSKKFRLFVIAMAAKVLISIIALAVVSYWAYTAKEAEAAYGLDSKITQVKTAASPAVYYLDHKRGLKKPYISAKAYLSYGNQWSDVKTVSQAELANWPEVSLVKSPSSNQVFYLSRGKKALINSERQFLDAGFSWSDIVTISEVDLSEYGAVDFSSALALVEPDHTLIGGGENAGGLLKISEQPFDSASNFIPTGSRNNLVAAFKFEALERDVKISQLTFIRQGVSSDAIVGAAYLTDEDGNLIGEKNSLNNGRLFLNLNVQPIIIPAGQEKTFYLIADFEPKSGVVGQTFKFGLLKAADITADAALNAAFPIIGPEFKLIDGAKNLGRLAVTPRALRLSGPETRIGLTGQALTAFRLAETSGNEDIIVEKITLTNIGSARPSDLRNLSLVASNGQTIARVQVMAEQKVTFDFGGGLFIGKNNAVDLTLKADILNGEGRNLKFVILGEQEASAFGLKSQYEINVTNGPALAGEVNNLVIKRAPIFLAASALKDNERLVYADQDEALVASFELRNNTSDLTLSFLTLKVVTSGLTPALDQSLTAFDEQGKELGVVAGSKVDNDFSELKLNQFTAPKGKTVRLLLKAHISDEAISGDSYQVIVKSVSYRIADDNITHSDEVNLIGQKMQVITPALYLYSGKIGERDLAVAGKSRVILGSFKAEAVKEENLIITGITITNAPGFKAVNYANGFSNLALYRGGSRISEVIAEPNSNSYLFSKINASLGAGSSMDILVKADLAKNSDGTVKLFMESARAQSRTSRIPAQVNNKGVASPEVQITQTVLSVEALIGGSAAKGQKDNKIASFSLTNNSAEKIKLGRVIINSSGFVGNLSNNKGFSNLRFAFTDNKGRLRQAGSRLGRPVADVNELNLNGFSLDPGENINLDLLMDAANDASGGKISLFLREIKVQGQLSGVEAQVNGVPTSSVEFSVGAADNGNNNDNGNVNNNGNGNGNGNQTVNFFRPVSGNINFGFHDQNYPYRATAGEHTGLDIYTAQGTQVKAAADGVVIDAFAGDANQASNITILHSNGLATKYVHLSRLDFKVGDQIKRGEVIGLSGGTPGTPGAGSLTNGPHLHFEVLLNGVAVDPEKYL